MKKIYLILAAAAGMTVASCTSDEYVGTNNPYGETAANDGSIRFGFNVQGMTRADDIAGAAAAVKLGGYFYVTGTKGKEETNSPSTNLVFDNYLVKFTQNTAGTTASNTANWEYVGVTADANHVKLFANDQTIKYWDYSTTQYDFHAFSTGSKKAVSGTSTAADEIGVTKSTYGAGLSGTAYTFDVPNAECLKNIYITDITPVLNANYGKDVQLKFKNLGSKIRIALYETVPGYSIQANSVKFYASATTSTDPTNGSYVAPTTTGTLISTDEHGLPLKGSIAVKFPNVGTANSSNANHNKASVDVTANTSDPSYYELTKTFGTIPSSEMVKKDKNEEDVTAYIGRSLPDASFVGDKNDNFYILTFPVDDSHPLTLRVDYTLLSTDGSGETINVHGATAVIPSTYTKWQPNYAYTYVFKISDKTNGTTDYFTQGLFPITFDAVVAEFTEVSGEQKTITTVATPSITTYQQNHDITKDEYSKATAKNIYVQVIKADGSLAKDLSTKIPGETDKEKSLLYSVAAGTSEAVVMDALEKRTNSALTETTIIGRNGITLTPSTITNTVTSIVNGVDDNPITVTTGTTGEIAYSLSAGTYAYVYDYTDAAKTVVTELQPLAVTPGSAIDGTSKQYYPIDITEDLKSLTPLTVSESVDNDYIYFSKTTTDGGTTYTYSYISVANKTTVPAGVIKLLKSTVTAKTTVAGTTTAETGKFYFDKYYSNKGQYAVKIIKIEA